MNFKQSQISQMSQKFIFFFAQWARNPKMPKKDQIYALTLEDIQGMMNQMENRIVAKVGEKVESIASSLATLGSRIDTVESGLQ